MLPQVINPALNCGAGVSLSADVAQLMALMLSSTEPSLPRGRATNLARGAEEGRGVTKQSKQEA